MRSGIAFAISAAAIAACDGSLREKVGASDVDASPLMTIPPPMCDPPAVAADTGACTGGAQPGADCLMCHHQGGGATPFTFAGTLYDAAGMQPVANATIYLQDAAGNVATALTHSNGNFFSSDGFVTYPAKAFASLCPTVLPMIGPVDEATG